MISRCAGLIYGPELHHLDHLGPLCSILGIPLIVTEEKIAALGRKYYPGLEVVQCDYLGAPEYVVSHFDILFYSIPRDLFDEVFFFAQKMAQKKVHTIWCPHGNSDKGEAIFYMEALKNEEAALVYGKQMIEFFKRKNVYDQLKGHVSTGNFRYEYYQANKAFYDSLVKLPQSERTLLYAPTWKDYENSSSFFDAAGPMIEALPENRNLIVKLHPNLLAQEEFKVEELIEKYEDRQNVLFLTDFSPVFPLLEAADVYIGDMSSIGYDFLLFDKPLFFLNQNAREGLYLFRCGIEIKKEQYGDIHQIIDNFFQYELRDFSTLRKEVCAFAFGHRRPLDEVKREIEHLYSVFPEKGLEFF